MKLKACLLVLLSTLLFVACVPGVEDDAAPPENLQDGLAVASLSIEGGEWVLTLTEDAISAQESITKLEYSYLSDTEPPAGCVLDRGVTYCVFDFAGDPVKDKYRFQFVPLEARLIVNFETQSGVFELRNF